MRRICDDINYVLLQGDIIELCTVNMYAVLKLTNKYSIIIIIIIVFVVVIFRAWGGVVVKALRY